MPPSRTCRRPQGEFMFWKVKALRVAKLPSNNQFRFSTLLFVAMLGWTGLGKAQSVATDPGVRGGAPGAGKPIAGLTNGQKASFVSGLDDFLEIQSVTGSVPDTGNGLDQDLTQKVAVSATHS